MIGIVKRENVMNNAKMFRIAIVVLAAIWSMSLFGEIDPVSVLQKIQKRLNESKTIEFVAKEERRGHKLETRNLIKHHSKSVMSMRQEHRAITEKGSSQPYVIVMDHNKFYSFPTGCGDVVVRMKFMERTLPNALANFFVTKGNVSMVRNDGDTYHIRYECTQDEVLALTKQLSEKSGEKIGKDLVPAVLDYMVDINTLDIKDVLVCSQRGKLIRKQSFSDWKYDVEVDDSKFSIPSQFVLYTVNSPNDAARLQKVLIKNLQKNK